MSKEKLNKLLISIGKGNEQAFEEFYYETYRGIYALIYPYFNNNLETEDLIQDIYILVKDKAYMYKKNTDARAWLFQLAKNTALNKIKKIKSDNNRVNTYYEINNQKEEKVDIDKHDEILKIMKKVLTEDEYNIVIKYIVFSLKHKEIAKEMDIPLGTVLSKYQTALKKVRKELKYEQ